MHKIIRNLYTKLLFKGLRYLRRKLLLTSVIVGPKNRVHIGEFCDLQDVILNTNSGHIFIGDHSFFGSGCMVLTGTHDLQLKYRARQQNHPVEGRDIHIGKGVWVASGAIIFGNVNIVDNVVIAAGSIVTKSCLEPGIYAGIPAHYIRPII